MWLSRTGPNWSVIGHDVLCPLCEYNLRGLSQPRCPECGYHFDWPEVLDPVRRPHPRLFEHHPERNLRSFFQTALDGLRPRKFWRSLNPAQPSSRRRLILYWALCCALFLGVTALASVPIAIAERQQVVAMGFVAPAPISKVILDACFYWMAMSILLGFLAAVWPWVTMLALMIFQWSMRRARIRRIHVLRCCLYSFDGLWWLGLAPLAGGALAMLGAWQFDPETVASGFFLPIVVGGWKLRQAYTYYLRFDRPGWTVLASQVIVVLALLCTWQMIDPYGPASLIWRFFR